MSEENNDIKVSIAKSDRLTSKEYLSQTKVMLRQGIYTQPYDFQKLRMFKITLASVRLLSKL